jgi:hypothetical protein
MLRQLVIAAAALVAATALIASEYRTVRRIPLPPDREAAARTPLPKGATRVEPPRPVEAGRVKRVLEDLMKSWNTPGMSAKLDPAFVNRTRLADLVSSRVPRDAKLRVMGIQGIRTLEQFTMPDRSSPGATRVTSRVAVNARTQVEVRSPTSGFVRGEGNNEFILKIHERVQN